MNFKRIAALIERDLRKFFRSPALMMVSMVLPLVQLIVLGYAFGGKVTGVKLGFVDMDHSVESRKVREMFDGISAGPRTFQVVEYDSVPQATHDLQTGLVRGLVVIPHDFSRRFYQKDRPRIAFTEDNTDQFISSALLERVQQMVNQLNAPDVTPRLEGSVQLNTVEIYPYVEYVKYLLAGTIALSVFVVAMIGGGITFIDDKARGLHEGYLV
ncbi:MAG: ABC transporter permease, partial [Candidatus Acidiferrales bacterium]